MLARPLYMHRIVLFPHPTRPNNLPASSPRGALLIRLEAGVGLVEEGPELLRQLGRAPLRRGRHRVPQPLHRVPQARQRGWRQLVGALVGCIRVTPCHTRRRRVATRRTQRREN